MPLDATLLLLVEIFYIFFIILVTNCLRTKNWKGVQQLNLKESLLYIYIYIYLNGYLVSFISLYFCQINSSKTNRLWEKYLWFSHISVDYFVSELTFHSVYKYMYCTLKLTKLTTNKHQEKIEIRSNNSICLNSFHAAASWRFNSNVICVSSGKKTILNVLIALFQLRKFVTA